MPENNVLLSSLFINSQRNTNLVNVQVKHNFSLKMNFKCDRGGGGNRIETHFFTQNETLLFILI